MTRTTSRRAVLGAVIAAGAAAASTATAMPSLSLEPDPIFGLIKAHRDAWATAGEAFIRGVVANLDVQFAFVFLGLLRVDDLLRFRRRPLLVVFKHVHLFVVEEVVVDHRVLRHYQALSIFAGLSTTASTVSSLISLNS